MKIAASIERKKVRAPAKKKLPMEPFWKEKRSDEWRRICGQEASVRAPSLDQLKDRTEGEKG